MSSQVIPFHTTDWNTVPVTLHKGETGTASWQTLLFENLRIRMVVYSANYLADHWCEKGHIIYCIEGSMETELATGERFTLTTGMTYQVSDAVSSHRSSSKNGVKLLIIDGAFLSSGTTGS